MIEPIQFAGRVDTNGILNLQLNLGAVNASQEVVVTVQPVNGLPTEQPRQQTWQKILAETYGSCAELESSDMNRALL